MWNGKFLKEKNEVEFLGWGEYLNNNGDWSSFVNIYLFQQPQQSSRKRFLRINQFLLFIGSMLN